MRKLTIALTGSVLLGLASSSSPAQEQPGVDVVSAAAPAPAPAPAPAAPSDQQPAQPAQPGGSLAGGDFSNEYLRLSIPRNANAGTTTIAGTIRRGQREYPFTARRDSDAAMTGTFKDTLGHTWPFTAKLDQDQLTFQTGQTTYLLTDDGAIQQRMQREGRQMGFGGGYFWRSRLGCLAIPAPDGKGCIISIPPGAQGGPAQRAGLADNDRIVQIDGRDVANAGQDIVNRLLRDAEPGTTVTVGILRGDSNEVRQYRVTRQPRMFRGGGGGGGGGVQPGPPQGWMSWAPDDGDKSPATSASDNNNSNTSGSPSDAPATQPDSGTAPSGR